MGFSSFCNCGLLISMVALDCNSVLMCTPMSVLHGVFVTNDEKVGVFTVTCLEKMGRLVGIWDLFLFFLPLFNSN